MSRASSLARLAAAYSRHQLRRLGRGQPGATAETVAARHRGDGYLPLLAAERARLPELGRCLNCGICALVVSRWGGVRPADLAVAYLRNYPLLAAAAGDLAGEHPALAAAAAACPVGVPLDEVAAMVARLAAE